MTFKSLKSLAIPEGKVKQITSGGAVLWKSGPSYTNLLPIAQEMNSDDPFNGRGYMMSKYLTSSSPFYSPGKANEWLTGCIPYTADKPIYIKGVPLASASHDRMYFFSDKTTRIAPAIHNGTAEIGNYFAMEMLGENYWKLTPISSAGFSADTRWVRMGFTTGTPSEVIITVNEEIV